jgi:putative DNA primase/helicase
MVQHIAGLTFLQACEELTGEPNPAGQKSKPLTEQERAERNRKRLENEAAAAARKAQEAAREQNTREAAQEIWSVSAPLCGPAKAYLAKRGFHDFTDPALRFHSSLPYPGMPGKYPALICRVDDVTGALAGIWRIYLTASGDKAPFTNPKLGLGPCAGGAVRIGGIGRHIGAAEGLESALGAYFLIGRKYPVWPTLSTAGLIGFEIPMEVERLTLYGDGDRPIRKRGEDFEPAVPAGRKAVVALRNRAISEGVGCDIAAEPPPLKDFNDLWLSRQGENA